jgi:hypothetical protein
MLVIGICDACNEYLADYNDSFTLDPFLFEHYKTRDCHGGWIGLDDKPISCLTIYAHNLERFSKPFPHKEYGEKLNKKSKD